MIFPNFRQVAILFVILLFHFAFGVEAQESLLPIPSQPELEKLLGGTDVIQIIQGSPRVEAVRVHVDDPRADACVGDQIVEVGKRFDLAAELRKETGALLTDRNIYLNGQSACLFEPGIRLIFHDPTRGSIQLLLCLHCYDVCIARGNESVGYAHFVVGKTRVMDLMRRIFPEDKDIQRLIDADKAQEEKLRDSEARWQAGMPNSIRPLWGKASEEFALLMKLSSEDLTPLRQALAEEFPKKSDQILALLKWYGSGEGPWSGFPAYEDVAEEILLEFSTSDIVVAAQSTSLSDAQLEGAARFFAGWGFSVHRPDDLKLVPGALKKTLLEHSLRSTDQDKQARAKRAFSSDEAINN